MQKWSLNFRLWHWINALVVMGLIGTVLLRKSFLSWRTNSEIIVQKLTEQGIDIVAEEAKIVAKAIRAPMWEWHIILGYALAALVVWRILLFFTQSGRQNYQHLQEENFHKKMVKIGYLVIYATLFFMTVSGLVIHFYETLGLAKDTAHDIKEIHELVYNVLLYFVPLHIIGVFVAENQNEKGILSDMVNGGKQ
ncbi:cytochrome b/b6 domain-containing protein [Sulfurovum riftiae]|uniref:Cytochrome B n=1 Tax=Sulfurovum riftiae TaxID=1630136 RepID=A0A151CIJ2_9BACT|nr:cytochrome b/b6 domain-containing protein [Sulfurovum riftiae]KYJ87355.1 cytochrome B [Sulfurovum riftiae]